jgi:hypothetical protein|tara:strand:- start:181 stop:429 length:249 start_codon:yes stop_codon:yes gene_type:complete
MDNLREENKMQESETIAHMQSAIDALEATKVQMQKLKADYQEALRLLARTEEERRIAVAQVAHFKEVVDQRNKELETRGSID